MLKDMTFYVIILFFNNINNEENIKASDLLKIKELLADNVTDLKTSDLLKKSNCKFTKLLEKQLFILIYCFVQFKHHMKRNLKEILFLQMKEKILIMNI